MWHWEEVFMEQVVLYIGKMVDGGIGAALTTKNATCTVRVSHLNNREYVEIEAEV